MTPPKIYHDTSITKTTYYIIQKQQGDRKQGVLGTGNMGYWGQEAGGTGDRKQWGGGTGAPRTLLVDNQRSVKLVSY